MFANINLKLSGEMIYDGYFLAQATNRKIQRKKKNLQVVFVNIETAYGRVSQNKYGER